MTFNMSAHEASREEGSMDIATRFDPVVKLEPVDRRNYSSLLLDDDEPKDSIARKSEPGSSVIKQELVDNVTIKKEPGEEEYEDAEPICASSEFGTRLNEQSASIAARGTKSHASSKDEGPAKSTETSMGEQVIYDLTGDEQNEVSWQMFDVFAETIKTEDTGPEPSGQDDNSHFTAFRGVVLPKGSEVITRPSGAWDDPEDASNDSTKRSRYGTSAKQDAVQRERNRLHIDAKPALGNPEHRYYEPEEYDTLIEESDDESDRPEWARAEMMLPTPRQTRSKQRKEEARQRELDKLRTVSNSYGAPVRVSKPAASMAVSSIAERENHELYAKKGLANGSAVVQQTPLVKQEAEATIPSNAMDLDGQTWCICHKKESGLMVQCDNEDCQTKWFHFECVGVKDHPEGMWFCSICFNMPRSEMTLRRSLKVSTASSNRSNHRCTRTRSVASRRRSTSRARQSSRTNSIARRAKPHRSTTEGMDSIAEEEMEM